MHSLPIFYHVQLRFAPQLERASWFLGILILAWALFAGYVLLYPPTHPNSGTFRYTIWNTTWAGYEAIPTKGHYATYVNGSWTVPAVSCSTSGQSAALIWVGIGGTRTNNTSPHALASGLEQIGTRIDCKNGIPVYSTWYQLFPAEVRTIPITNVTQKAGDNVTASVSYSNVTQLFTFSIATTSDPTGYTFSLLYPGNNHTSAEWIVEAPSYFLRPATFQNQTFLQMPDFYAVSFRGCYATIDGHTYQITGFGGKQNAILYEEEYICVDNSGLKAAPTSITNSGRDFEILWRGGGTC
jgi:hypothetical protein